MLLKTAIHGSPNCKKSRVGSSYNDSTASRRSASKSARSWRCRWIACDVPPVQNAVQGLGCTATACSVNLAIGDRHGRMKGCKLPQRRSPTHWPALRRLPHKATRSDGFKLRLTLRTLPGQLWRGIRQVIAVNQGAARCRLSKSPKMDVMGEVLQTSILYE